MRSNRVFLAAALFALATLLGCSPGDKTAGHSSSDSQVEVERKETEALETRLDKFKVNLDRLDTKHNKFNEALKDELLRLYQSIKIETLRKNALEGTIPPNARERMASALDEAEKKIANFPK